MRDPRPVASLASLVLFVAASCSTARVDPTADQARARELIRSATGRSDVHDPTAAPQTAAELDALLADGLALDEALRIALLENRGLQAAFAELGIARADFVQSGLVRNPRLGVGVLLPSGGGRTKLGLDLVQSLFELWELPAREAAAEAVVEERVLELARAASELVVATRDAYHACVAARELADSARESERIAADVLAAVEERERGGVASRPDVELARGRALSARLESLRVQREELGARRELARQLSLEREVGDVALVDALPAPELLGIDREDLVGRARAARLDLRASSARVEAARARVALERRRAMPEVEGSASLERPERGSEVGALSGLGATVELPIFDTNAAQVRRAEFELERLQRLHEALERDVDADVRSAADRAAIAAAEARFVEEELLPMTGRAAGLAREAYALGDVTLLALFEHQRAELEARRARTAARLEAARARGEVERAAGAAIEVLRAQTAADSSSGSPVRAP
ncbi:MAG: TolC family protein [Planctomycetes bacterium]|nr:TolC family protein [Planctomycetota bacterium]